MMLDEFFVAVDNDDLKIIDRAIKILWFSGQEDDGAIVTVAAIADIIERHGHPRPNVTRLHDDLAKDRRAVRNGKTGWKLSPKARRDLDDEHRATLNLKRKAPPSDSVLPRELFNGSHTYLEKVVYQINASYDLALYDCCAVMCRRLIETLIIEVYEHRSRAEEIKNKGGNFLMLADLIGHLESDTSVNLSRNAKNGLRALKQLGDLSAHNRRHNAVQNDIDRARDGLRIAAGELLAISGLATSTKSYA